MRNAAGWLAIGVAALAACGTHAPGGPEPVLVKDLSVDPPRALDLLFVMDNTSNADPQASLASNSPILLHVLDTLPHGRPDLHVGVTTGDLGAGVTGIVNCVGNGDDGMFETSPQLAGTFLEDAAAAVAGAGTCPSDPDRDCNYTGTFWDVFTDLAAVGVDGCGFEQPLEAMRRALDGRNPGFLRDGALLGVVFVQDEDDCSTRDPGLLTTDTSADTLARLGPLASFRCTEFGVDCATGNADPRAPGPRTGCGPRIEPDPYDPTPYVYGVQEYADFLRGLEVDGRQVVVAGIMGDPEPFAVVPDPEIPSRPALAHSCSSASDTAVPAVRMQYLLDQFPADRRASTSICAENLAAAVIRISATLKQALGTPCLTATLAEPATCTVADVAPDDTTTWLPACDAVEPTPLDTSDPPASTDVPCWHLEPDPHGCAETPTTLSLVIERGGAVPAAGTHVRAWCVTCEDADQDGVCDPAAP